jgi:hypothetical protein
VQLTPPHSLSIHLGPQIQPDSSGDLSPRSTPIVRSFEGTRFVSSPPRSPGSERIFENRILETRSRRPMRSEHFDPSSWVLEREVSITSGEGINAVAGVSSKCAAFSN